MIELLMLNLWHNGGTMNIKPTKPVVRIANMHLYHVVHGKRHVTARLAVFFAKAFYQTPQYRMDLQASYDLKVTEMTMTRRIKHVQPITMAA